VYADFSLPARPSDISPAKPRAAVHITPDQIILWTFGFGKINSTIATTWGLMVILGLGAHLITRRLTSDVITSRWQAALEIIVTGIEGQIAEVGLSVPSRYLAFIGTLFVFVATANLLTLLPGYVPPTSSLSTTAALALCVFVAVPAFGIARRGWRRYLKSYLEPTVIMLPFNLISELSRTLALAVRLFGNMMSGTMIIAILLTITPFIFPVAMTLLGLLTGMVQAYIFSILATVYIAAATGDNDA
jgi:F-type H+-transporting ATPase subunit a